MYQKLLPLTPLLIVIGCFIGCGDLNSASSTQPLKLRTGTPSEENHQKAEASFYDFNFTDALAYDKAQLTEDLTYFREESAEIALDYNNIALDYAKLKEFNLSLEFYQKAMLIDTKVLDLNNTERLTTFYNIASTYESLKVYKQAEAYYLKSLEGSKNKEQIFMSFQDIARVYTKEKKYEDAILYYQKALNMELNLNRKDNSRAVIEALIIDLKKRIK